MIQSARERAQARSRGTGTRNWDEPDYPGTKPGPNLVWNWTKPGLNLDQTYGPGPWLSLVAPCTLTLCRSAASCRVPPLHSEIPQVRGAFTSGQVAVTVRSSPGRSR
ncbi:hypothetical protein NQD34_004144 [Periophthalmus magnuspinnatus]|nr:hypothetical protein NQD34_004144 [Periophthalmus magnuspinnatus]